MENDRGDSFPLDFEPNGIPFVSKLKGKLSPRSDTIQFERKCDSFPFDFEPNGIPLVSKSKGKLSPRSYPIQFERKRKRIFF